MNDGRLLVAATLLGLVGAAAARGSRGVVRRGRESKSFDLKAMLDRLILVEADYPEVGWVAYDPDHELPCNLFHILAAKDHATGKIHTPNVGNWAYEYHTSEIGGEGADQIVFTLNGEGFIGKEIAFGRNAIFEKLAVNGNELADNGIEAFIAAIVACQLDKQFAPKTGSRGVVRKGRVVEPREVRIVYRPSREHVSGEPRGPKPGALPKLPGTWHALRGERELGPGWYDTETGYPRQGGSGKGAAVKVAFRELDFTHRISDKGMRELLQRYCHDADLRMDATGQLHELGITP